MGFVILAVLLVLLIASLYYLFINETGIMFRIGMMSTIRAIYRFLHPGKRAMPESLAESRRIFHGDKDETAGM